MKQSRIERTEGYFSDLWSIGNIHSHLTVEEFVYEISLLTPCTTLSTLSECVECQTDGLCKEQGEMGKIRILMCCARDYLSNPLEITLSLFFIDFFLTSPPLLKNE